jgi:hypothetical protein
MDCSVYLPRLAKVLIDLNFKADGEYTTYFIPPFWNHIEKNAIKGRSQIRPEPEEIEGETEYEVECILRSEVHTTC